MKFYLALLTGVLFCVSIRGAESSVSEARALRLMTYNVMGGRNTDGSHNIDRIAEVIRAWKPDVVSLQEVDRKTTRFKGRDLGAELGKRLDMHHVFGEALALQGGGYGQTVLSKWNITHAETHALLGREGVEPRCALAVETHPAHFSSPVRLIAVHLDHKADATDRLMQVGRLLELFPDTLPKSIPTILAGDINAEPGSPTLARLGTVWADAWPDGPATYASHQPTRRIDYIFTHMTTPLLTRAAWRGDELPHAPEGWARTLALASDHLPVIIDFAAPVPKPSAPTLP